MSVIEPGSTGANIIARIKAILLQPKPTWEVIDAEPATVGGLYRSYVIPLAAIPAVCGLIGSVVFGFGFFGVTYRPPILNSVVLAVVQFGLSLAHVFVLGLIIDALAPSFGGTRNPIQAFKVATYSMTASWLAGVFTLVPALSILGIVGLYSLYLLYLGLPRLMKVAEEKATAYTVLVIVAGVALFLLISMFMSTLGGIGRMAHMSGPVIGAGQISGKINTPAGSVDLAKLQAASKQLEAASSKAQANGGTVKLTDPELLKAYLPGSIGGFARTGVSAESGGAGGMGASTAEGTYQKGEATLRVQVTDMGATGAIAGIAGAFNVQSSHEENGRYEKVGKVDGRMTTESYDRTARHGEYSVMVADRFMVHAEGDGVGVDELKAAVAAVNPGRLEGLAKS
ncbi:MAG TPA: Yip1 family protein [Phenylobacterium sp.]|nr:Yip1 family protein [Phenylobacterium sp.]